MSDAVNRWKTLRLRVDHDHAIIARDAAQTGYEVARSPRPVTPQAIPYDQSQRMFIDLLCAFEDTLVGSRVDVLFGATHNLHVHSVDKGLEPLLPVRSWE